MSDAQAIIHGCDETADCPAAEHSSHCWRGYWAGPESVDSGQSER